MFSEWSLILNVSGMKMTCMRGVGIWVLMLLFMEGGTYGSKILLIPVPHYSHVNFHAISAKLLQESGHDVSVLVPEEFTSRVTKVGVKAMSYPYSADADPRVVSARFAGTILTGGTSLMTMVFALNTAFNNLCRQVLENKKLLEQIKKEKFDLTINDSAPLTVCFYIINYKFNIPYITMGPWMNPWGAGVPNIPSHSTSILLSYHGRLTFMERVASAVISVLESNLQYTAVSGDSLIAEFAPEMPPTTFRNLSTSAELYLVTLDINCFSFPRVSTPNYRFIGSISGSTPSKELPEYFNKIVTSAKKGIIIVAFGSLGDLRKALIPYMGKFFGAVSRLEQKVILQFTDEDLKDYIIPDNVYVKSWLPQNDLLGHPNTKLFVSHGGLNSHLEATYHGIPILTLPFQDEQKGNGRRAIAKGHGELLLWPELTEEDLYNTMTKLIKDPSYKKNTQHCSAILKDIPNARDELVFWVNHILKFGGAHLRPTSADMGTMEFFMIDVILFIGGIFATVIVVLYCCCAWIIRRCTRSGSDKKKQN